MDWGIIINSLMVIIASGVTIYMFIELNGDLKEAAQEDKLRRKVWKTFLISIIIWIIVVITSFTLWNVWIVPAIGW